MDGKLPSFLRRRLLLFEARRALLAGEPEEALSRLADRVLADHPPAVALRARVLDVLGREALRAHGRGEEGEASRLLALLAAEDPERGRAWARRVELLRGDGGETRRTSRRVRGALARALEEMRAARPAGEPPSRALASAATQPAVVPPAPTSPGGLRPRFRLAVDDAGEFLAVCGGPVVLGHLRGEGVDLPLLADVDPRAARILRLESFHGGPQWRIEPLGARPILLRGREVDVAGALLADGDVVRLGPNLEFRFRLPDPSSATAVLELRGGAECDGAGRVLLVGEGPAGRVRIGPHPARHVPVARLAADLSLECTPEGLAVESPAPFLLRGWQAPVEARNGTRRAVLPCPPPVRVDLVLEEPARGRAPFTVTLRDAARPPSWSGGPR